MGSHESLGIVGDGGWGMALARRLNANGHQVTVAGLRNGRRHPRGLNTTDALNCSKTVSFVMAVPIHDFENDSICAADLRPVHRVMTTHVA